MKRKPLFPEQVASTEVTKKNFFDKLAKPDERLSILAAKVPQGYVMVILHWRAYEMLDESVLPIIAFKEFWLHNVHE